MGSRQSSVAVLFCYGLLRRLASLLSVEGGSYVKKKTKLHMPTWLVITLFVLGVLFLLGGIVGHTDMVIIGCVLTTLSIIGSARIGNYQNGFQ